ncbi:MAG: imelysin family protein [Oligoflexus sp.]|nr:imelysin family protein [Oligoflexus sp.]
MYIPALLAFFVFLCVACNGSSGSSFSPVAPAPTVTNPGSGGDTAGNTTDPAPSPSPALESDEPKASTLTFPLGLTISRADYLRKIGSDFAKRAASFQSAVTALNASTQAYCSAPTTESKIEAQNQWRQVMTLWQYFEVLQIGPVGENAKTLKYSIYAWPDAANLCKVDEEALKASKSSTYKLPPNNNRKGLQAIEYLLFEDSLLSRCAAGTAVATEWNAQTIEVRNSTRCAYLKPLTAEIVNQSNVLVSKTGTEGDNFIGRVLGNAAAEQDLIQAIYQALFFVDLEVKNQKISAPAGLGIAYCANSPLPCPEKAEFEFSDFSLKALDVNFTTFSDIIFGSATGGRQGGLSALLRASGESAAAERSEATAAKIGALVESHDGLNLNGLIVAKAQENCDVSSTSWICVARSSIRSIFVDLKAEYAKILQVKAPEAAAGDND